MLNDVMPENKLANFGAIGVELTSDSFCFEENLHQKRNEASYWPISLIDKILHVSNLRFGRVIYNNNRFQRDKVI